MGGILCVILGILGGALLFMAAGRSLGVYIGALGWGVIVAPYLALMSGHRLLARHYLPLLFIIGLGGVWLWGAASLIQIVQCWVVLLALTMTLVEASALALRVMRNPILAAGVAVLIGVAWLSCPIWLSHTFQGGSGQKIANWLVAVHPLFAINGTLASLGAWPEQSLAYHLTNLGQDVSYALPSSIWPSVVFHGIIAMALAVLDWLVVCKYLPNMRLKHSIQ